MKLVRTIRKSGDSLSIGIPFDVVELTGVKKGDKLSIDFENNKMIVEFPEPSKVTGIPQADHASLRGDQHE